MASLVYADYRPIREGDSGWTAKKEKARWYYSPSRKVSIPIRRFQELARGMSYTEYRKKREAMGVPKGSRIKGRYDYRTRADMLKESFARKHGQYTGRDNWNELTDDEKTEFWDIYHKLVEEGTPSYTDYTHYYSDYFDLEYGDYDNIEYGPTP